MPSPLAFHGLDCYRSNPVKGGTHCKLRTFSSPADRVGASSRRVPPRPSPTRAHRVQPNEGTERRGQVSFKSPAGARGECQKNLAVM
jgi:hypothetical protein